MTAGVRTVAVAVTATIVAGVVLFAQGRGGQNWNTVGADAQRTGWLRVETRISTEAFANGGFQLLWKVRPENQARQLATLTQPLILGNLISHKGFKALAFIGASADIVYAYDYDLAKMYWSHRLSTGVAPRNGTIACPGALTSITRNTPLMQSAVPARGAPPVAPQGGGGRGPQSGINPANLPITNAVWAISSGGMVHALNPHVGDDLRPPARLVPAGAKVTGSVLVDNVLYAATSDGCGGAPNGVWELDVSGDGPSLAAKTWSTGGPSIAGTAGPAIGLNNVLYVATAGGSGQYANALIALDPQSLQPLAWFSGEAAFTTSPVAFNAGGRDLVAAAAADGRLYLFDGTAPGGADHRSALARSPAYANLAGEFSSGTVATWEDAGGVRWLLVASAGRVAADAHFGVTNGAVTNGTVAAFRVVADGTALKLEPAWTSRDLVSPTAPVVLNDVVFALSSGEFRTSDPQMSAAQRLQRSSPAVLYALDGQTGKQLWSSERTMTVSVQRIAPSGQDGQIYVVGADGTLYAFGIPLEH